MLFALLARRPFTRSSIRIRLSLFADYSSIREDSRLVRANFTLSAPFESFNDIPSSSPQLSLSSRVVLHVRVDNDVLVVKHRDALRRRCTQPARQQLKAEQFPSIRAYTRKAPARGSPRYANHYNPAVNSDAMRCGPREVRRRRREIAKGGRKVESGEKVDLAAR